IFQSFHPDPRLCEVHLIASQSNRFADPQSVAVHHQHQKMIARAVPATLRRLKQSFNLLFVQEILAALVRVGGARCGRDTLSHQAISRPGRWVRLRSTSAETAFRLVPRKWTRNRCSRAAARRRAMRSTRASRSGAAWPEARGDQTTDMPPATVR